MDSTSKGMFMPASRVSARAASPCDWDPMAMAAFENSSIATSALTGSPAASFDSARSQANRALDVIGCGGIAIFGILKGSRRGSANASVGGGGGGS